MRCIFRDSRNPEIDCQKRAVSNSWYCSEHSKLKCSICGNQANGYQWLNKDEWFLTCCEKNCYRTAKMRLNKKGDRELANGIEK